MRAAGRRTAFGSAPLKAALSLGLVALLTGCTASAPPYQATLDNVRTLQTLPGGKVAIGPFTCADERLNHLAIRLSTYESPVGNSFAEYLRSALTAELQAAGKVDAGASTVITGELLTNAIDDGLSASSAHVSARIVVKRGAQVRFDKVVHGDTEWESSVIGAVAIPLDRQHHGDTIKQLLAALFADRDFQASIGT